MRCELCLEQTTYVGHLLDVSLSGALVSLGCKPAVGSPVTIDLELLEPLRKISLAGRVVRVSQGNSSYNQVYRVGIRFSAVTPDGIILLKATLEKGMSIVSLPTCR